MEEFFRQGDCERSLNLPISFLCDRHSVQIPASQRGMCVHTYVLYGGEVSVCMYTLQSFYH